MKSKEQLMRLTKEQLADMVILLEKKFNVNSLLVDLEDVEDVCDKLSRFIDIDTIQIENDIDKTLNVIKKYMGYEDNE